MAILERVFRMKSQGIPEDEIIRSLQSEGISPKEIVDALSQSKIKQAVSYVDEDNEMEPSMMGKTLSEYKEQQNYKPQNSSSYMPPQNPENSYQPQMPPQYSNPYYDSEANQTEEYYPQENNSADYAYSQNSTDTTIEIAEQVFTEKIKKIQKQMNELSEFKSIFEVKVENIEERLKRIEKMFDQMQISIIEKVGNYGKGLDNLKKEIEMVEDSVSKVFDKKINSKEETTKRKISKK
ncbi:MAG: hypothetical protein WC812_03680 [Candidatus Pacearchaeota archaeon]|jgi:DNA-binding transcriptional MerR regulator